MLRYSLIMYSHLPCTSGCAAAALLGGPLTRVVHDDLAHGQRGQGEEVAPVLDPCNRLRAEQLHEGLVHERRGLQGPARRARAEAASRRGLELLEDEREDVVVGMSSSQTAKARGPVR